MKLLVDRIETSPTAEDFVATRAWWDEWAGQASQFPYGLVGEPHFAVEVYAAGEDIHLRGRLTAELDVECSRCLKRYRHALSEGFRLVLEPIRGRKPDDPEGAAHLERYGMCLGEDLEIGWYRGKEVSLDPFLAEVAALAMPVQPLCREDCAGLCPHCGIDRSEGSCDCKDQKPDSPFAALAVLRTDSDGST